MKSLKKSKKLKDLNQKLTPLFAQLRQHQIYTLWSMKENSFLVGNGQTYWQTQREFLYLKTNCNIDTTTKRSWTPYVNDPTVDNYLTELQKFLFDNRLTNFRIRHIKRQ